VKQDLVVYRSCAREYGLDRNLSCDVLLRGGYFPVMEVAASLGKKKVKK
jgi:hypothetical protein